MRIARLDATLRTFFVVEDEEKDEDGHVLRKAVLYLPLWRPRQSPLPSFQPVNSWASSLLPYHSIHICLMRIPNAQAR